MQNAYLCGCVKVQPVARRYSPSSSSSRRQNTQFFYVKKGGVSVRVCKKVFLNMHSVSNGWLDCALKTQVDDGGSVHCDQRGRHEPGNKTKQVVIDDIKAHINSFPKYKSHYSREDNPHRQFLSPSLTLQKMYSFYKEKCERDGTTTASDWIYRKVFNEHFNLSFGRYVATHTHTHTHMHMHTHAHTHTHTCAHARTRTCAHTHTHTHTYSCTYKPVCTCSNNYVMSYCHFPYTHSPKSDTCKVCDSLKVQIDAESDIS